MLKTDVEKELKKMCIDEGVAYTEIMDKITSRPNFYKCMRHTETFVKKVIVDFADALGYDVEIKFIKR